MIRDVRSGRVRFSGYFWPDRDRDRLPLPRKATNRDRNRGQPVGHGRLPVATELQPVGTVNLYLNLYIFLSNLHTVTHILHPQVGGREVVDAARCGQHKNE